MDFQASGMADSKPLRLAMAMIRFLTASGLSALPMSEAASETSAAVTMGN
jgi:hypothetical protein